MRASYNIRNAWLALTTAWLAACSSALPGARSSPVVPQQPLSQPPVASAVPEGAPSIGAAPSPSLAPAPSTAADASGSAPSPAGESAPSPPAATPSYDARDRQFEILNAAVSALRQEVTRSYARAEELGAENQRLRALVASLRQDLRKSRGANKALDDHLRTLEKKLREISSPPQDSSTPQESPKTETSGATAPEEKAVPTPPPPPTPETSPPTPRPEDPGDDGGDEGSAAPADDAD